MLESGTLSAGERSSAAQRIAKYDTVALAALFQCMCLLARTDAFLGFLYAVAVCVLMTRQHIEAALGSRADRGDASSRFCCPQTAVIHRAGELGVRVEGRRSTG